MTFNLDLISKVILLIVAVIARPDVRTGSKFTGESVGMAKQGNIGSAVQNN